LGFAVLGNFYCGVAVKKNKHCGVAVIVNPAGCGVCVSKPTVFGEAIYYLRSCGVNPFFSFWSVFVFFFVMRCFRKFFAVLQYSEPPNVPLR